MPCVNRRVSKSCFTEQAVQLGGVREEVAGVSGSPSEWGSRYTGTAVLVSWEITDGSDRSLSSVR